MAECVFCEIVRGKIPCAKIYEDELVVSFLDIAPINPGHALVVTRNHYPTLFEAPPEELEACIVAAQRVGRALCRAVGATGLNLLQNNANAAGQLIEHVHFHLIPRHVGDGFFNVWPGKSYPPGEMERTLERIRAQL